MRKFKTNFALKIPLDSDERRWNEVKFNRGFVTCPESCLLADELTTWWQQQVAKSRDIGQNTDKLKCTVGVAVKLGRWDPILIFIEQSR